MRMLLPAEGKDDVNWRNWAAALVLGWSWACLTSVTLVSEARAADRPADLEMHEIAPGHFVHFGSHDERSPANMGDNANIGFIVGDDCVLVVDAGGSAAVGQALRRQIRARTPLPICHVVLTHVHPDHFFGAAAFVQDRPAFIAHANYPAQLAARARPYANALARDLGPLADGSEIVEPTRLVQDRLTIDLGGRVVEVRAWGPGHTDNDLTVFEPASRTLWLSDLLFVEHTPVIDATLTGFLAVMAELATLEVARYVPGHGRPQLPWPQALGPQQRYFELILRETREAIRNRRTIQQAVDEVGLSAAGDWAQFDLYHRRNVTTAYTELEWE